jgi:hypothetical protein
MRRGNCVVLRLCSTNIAAESYEGELKGSVNGIPQPKSFILKVRRLVPSISAILGDLPMTERSKVKRNW